MRVVLAHVYAYTPADLYNDLCEEFSAKRIEVNPSFKFALTQRFVSTDVFFKDFQLKSWLLWLLYLFTLISSLCVITLNISCVCACLSIGGLAEK